MEKKQESNPKITVKEDKPSLNVKIPRNFLLISILTFFLSLIVWGMTFISKTSPQILAFCFLGSMLFSFCLFFEHMAHFLYQYWEDYEMNQRLNNPLVITILQFYYYISSLTIAWISYTLSEGEFQQLLFYLIVLFLPVFISKGTVRIQHIRDTFIRMSTIQTTN